MDTIILSKLQFFLIESITTYILEISLLASFGFIVCGLKNKLSLKRLLLFSVIISASLIIVKLLPLESKGLHTIVYILLGLFLIKHIFKIDYLSAAICHMFTILFTTVAQYIYFTLLGLIAGINYANIISANTFTLKLLLTDICIMYVFYVLVSLFIFYIYKKDVVLIDLTKHRLFNFFSNEFLNNIKLFTFTLFPIFVLLIIKFCINYYHLNNNSNNNPFLLNTLDSLTLIISSALIIFLVKKIIYLKNYKIEYKTQQKHLDDINTLLKQFREQKHGFINHMNIIHGYLSIQNYDKAKEYLQNINQAVSSQNNIIDVKNSGLNALLNIKLIIAESKNIKFEVNVYNDISTMNFKMFEMGEAIANIIDNAIEAVCEKNKEDRLVKIDIYSNDDYYILDVQNAGHPIPPKLLHKIFEQGFSTKNYEYGEHGIGLYISKKLIEHNKGKIEVKSNDNITSFKIYLPKIENNKSQAS